MLFRRRGVWRRLGFGGRRRHATQMLAHDRQPVRLAGENSSAAIPFGSQVLAGHDPQLLDDRRLKVQVWRAAPQAADK